MTPRSCGGWGGHVFIESLAVVGGTIFSHFEHAGAPPERQKETGVCVPFQCEYHLLELMGVVPGVESRHAIDFAAITAVFAKVHGGNAIGVQSPVNRL